jgi:murein DD-endopeptidase MepM/ murein hydrolase activator NlpD
MRRRIAVGAASVLGGLVLALARPAPAAGADDYTLPFYDPGTTLSYGMDRDPRDGFQLDFTGHLWRDDDPHPGRVYDNHTGQDYPMPVRTAIAAARDGVVVDVEGGYGTEAFGPFGNFVRVRHTDGRQTLYYHLAAAAEDGIGVGIGETVPAGEPVGLSGCSGWCFGPHLHFEVLVERGQELDPSDPHFRRLWTTWPARVPFLAAYERESNPGTVSIRRGQTVTHWVELRNLGGRTWRNNVPVGRIALGTWNPPAHDSPFSAGDWPYRWMATPLDQASVAPDQVGRFTFGLRGGPPPGAYDQPFNLVAQSVRWFDHARIGQFHVPIVVTN